MPVYSFNVSKRMDYTQKVSPKKVIIFEGIFSFCEKKIRDLMDIKLFFDLDSDIRLSRRIIRDISDRSRVIKTVIERYFRFVKPAFDIYILPTKKYADFVIQQDNLSSLPIEIVSHNIIANDLHIKKELVDKMRRKESIFIIQEDFDNKKYFFDPKIEELSVVNSEKDIKKFNKIIYHVIYKLKIAYFSIYCNSIVDYLLKQHKIKNKENLRSIFVEITDINDIKKLKEKIKKEEKFIVSIFEPNLIQRNQDLENYLKNLFEELKDYNIQYEILTVYMTHKTFKEINSLLTNAGVKINYITVYFGDNLFPAEENLLNYGNNKTSLNNIADNQMTRGNLITNFLLKKNDYLN